MLDDLTDLDYNPNNNVTKYKGPYPINELKKVRCKLIDDLKKHSRTKNELDIKRKCAIFTRDLMDYMLKDKKPDDFIENSAYVLKSNNTNPFVHKILDIDQDDLIVPNEEQTSVENTLSVNKAPLTSSSSETSFKNSQTSENKTTNTSSPFNQQFSSLQSDEILRINRELGIGVRLLS